MTVLQFVEVDVSKFQELSDVFKCFLKIKFTNI